ncbi:MAG: Transcriptional regulator, AraC family [Verrucomicrobiaceae bacterium]|nr:Transcriptional regulator, AraC family [Verrucomicrobiaceae bacterium]
MTGMIADGGFEVQTNELRLPQPGNGIYQSSTHCFLEYVELPETTINASYPEAVTERPVGKLIFVPRGMTLRWHWPAGQQRAVALAFDTNRLAGLAALDFDWNSINLDDTFNIDSPYLESMMATLSDEACSPGYGSAIKASSLVTLLALELGRKFISNPHFLADNSDQEIWNSDNDAQKLQQLRAYIAREEDIDLSPQRLAEVCRMSPRSLSLLLVKNVGMTLRSYAAVARLERAKLLLAQEDGLVKQVAYRCGFKGTAAFGAAFRKALGMTPQEYRQRHQSCS